MTSGFTALAMQLLRDRTHARCLRSPDFVGYSGDEGAGDYVVLEFSTQNNLVSEVGYRCNGCPTTIACCELLATLIVGRKIEVLNEITPEVVTKLLGQTAEGKEGIPAFVHSSLTDALNTKTTMQEKIS
jgi:NifU-like protein involved in Fe-S cluster formation